MHSRGAIETELADRRLESERGYSARLRERCGRLQDFFDTWELCESNRGCYSCVPVHDCRCPRYHYESAECECGRADLEAAADVVRAK